MKKLMALLARVQAFMSRVRKTREKPVSKSNYVPTLEITAEGVKGIDSFYWVAYAMYIEVSPSWYIGDPLELIRPTPYFCYCEEWLEGVHEFNL